jgi:hypothetical protein
MTIVAVAALVFALIVVFAALGFVRWSFRALERKDRALEGLRVESLERYARLVGQQLHATPRERAAEVEQREYQLDREYQRATILEDPEQAVEYPSASEGRFKERLIAAELDELNRNGGSNGHEPLFVDIAADGAR